MFGIEKDFQQLMEQVYGPLNKDKMSDLKITSPSGETTIKVEDTGRIGTVTPKTQLHIKDEPVKYEKPMTAVEDIEAQIKVLQSKLEFYKELERTKTPCEEAYKRVYGNYPVKVVSEELTPKDNWNVISWDAFQRGYEQSQRDYKVGEYQETVEEPKEPKTLYQMFYDNKWTALSCDDFCNIVKEWMSQYDCETNKWDEDYKCGFLDCINVLRKNLK